MKKISSGLFLSAIVSLAASSHAWDNNQLDAYWHTENTQALTEAGDGESFSHLYANYRLAMIALHNDDKKAAKKPLDHIRKTLKGNYQTADEAALYSAALGQSITLKPWQAAFIAGGAEDALDFSFELTDAHAPTLMVKAIAKYNTPSLMGGDKAEALALFNAAIELYETNEAWGYEDALLWKAKAEHALGNTEQAEQTREKLLALYPSYYEVQALVFE